MAILWHGGEPEDFPIDGTIAYTPSYCRVGYARCAIWRSSVAIPYSKPFPKGAVTSCWLSFQCIARIGYVGILGDNLFVGLAKSGTDCGLYLGGWHNVQGNFALYKYSAATGVLLLQEETGYHFVGGVLHKIDLKVTNFGVTGNVKVYVNSGASPIIDYTGDLTLTGMTEIDRVALTATASYEPTGISEIIVADEDTRTMSRWTATDEAGESNGFNGTFSDVSEISVNDATVIYTDTASVTFLANLSAPPSGVFQVLSAKRLVRACVSSDASIGKVALGFKSGSTISVTTAQTVTIPWDSYEYYADANPVTGSSFTLSELSTLQGAIASAS